ncbi:hypothetical protein K2173_019050 [Erythroxylum novogranatense]|uniref:Mitochondrial glycoprotein n=1 Tax=Erythroxylum novogranatense TaxID=1862640 RepID=A0AAV8SSK2_9ROSI|nr:hypothetical protein K2173_019050 [Erythroxylum novogranatense]
MARLIRPLSRTLLYPPKALIYPFQETLNFPLNKPRAQTIQFTRSYVSEMRKAAFNENILRLLRREIQYELDHTPPDQPPAQYNSFIIDQRPGEQWIGLKRKYTENEEIKVEATTFDGAVPISKDGGITIKDAVKLHISMIVNICKGDSHVLEIICSAWPDSLEITKLFVHSSDKKLTQPYAGPGFKELDDELQDALYEFLERRGIDDDMAEFLHEFMKHKDRSEYIRWINTVKSYIEQK